MLVKLSRSLSSESVSNFAFEITAKSKRLIDKKTVQRRVTHEKVKVIEYSLDNWMPQNEH